MQHEVLYKCRLLLFEDPALEAQPRHEVAVSVGRNERGWCKCDVSGGGGGVMYHHGGVVRGHRPELL